MVDYRCYLLDGAGAIRLVEAVQSGDDDGALRLARRLISNRPEFHGFELWQGRRRVHVEVTEPV
jgi:hypothetical protein